MEQRKNTKLTLCSLDRANLNSLYENLREEALKISIDYTRKTQGLALFICRGMAAWIEAWAQCSLPPFKEDRENFSLQNPPVNLHAEITMLLTDMAFNVYSGG